VFVCVVCVWGCVCGVRVLCVRVCVWRVGCVRFVCVCVRAYLSKESNSELVFTPNLIFGTSIFVCTKCTGWTSSML